MRAPGLLEVHELQLIEPSYAELTNAAYDVLAMELEAEEARLLVDEQEAVLALALRAGERWFAWNFLHRAPGLGIVERFEEVGGEIHQAAREAWMEAVREYYSLRIMREITPALEDVTPRRAEILRGLIAALWRGREGSEVIEACCGSGIGSAVLRELGFRPLSFDNDPSLLSLGLSRGRLLPERACCIDGARAGEYLEPAPLGAIFMLGEVNSFTRASWEDVVDAMLPLAGELVATLGTRSEAETIAEWSRERDRSAEIREHALDPFYDRWVCIVRSP